MRKTLLRHLEALERQCGPDQEAARRQAFLDFAVFGLLAYHVGGLKSNEDPFEGIARALNYRTSLDLFKACGSDKAKVGKRIGDARRQFFSHFERHPSPQEPLEEAIPRMAARLPKELQAWIADCADKKNGILDGRRERRERRRTGDFT